MELFLFQHSMDAVKEEPDSETEIHQRSSSDEDQVDIKQEHLLEPFSFVEVKQELVCITSVM
jgi:hypothetical protein